MAKKEILNPITAFRKANEARKAVVVNSLKKAQEGIAQDTSAINPSFKKYKPWEGNAKLNTPRFSFLDPTDPYKDKQMNTKSGTVSERAARAASFEGPKSISTKSSKSASDVLNSYNNSKKKGGVVKRKK